MSQAGMLNLAAGPVPPSVPTSFVTDVNSPSIPIANVENVLGGSTTTNNLKGIQTDGSSGSNTLTIQLTNRFQTSQTFSDNAVHTIFTFPLGAVAGTYIFTFQVAAFNNTLSLGAGYSVTDYLRTDGASGFSLPDSDKFFTEEGTMTNGGITYGVSGNNFTVTVHGYGGDKINWNLTGTYIFQGNI